MDWSTNFIVMISLLSITFLATRPCYNLTSASNSFAVEKSGDFLHSVTSSEQETYPLQAVNNYVQSCVIISYFMALENVFSTTSNLWLKNEIIPVVSRVLVIKLV